MNINEKVKIQSYFQARQVNEDYYKEVDLPFYLKQQLPANKDAKILDIGCGLGQTLAKLSQYGYTSLTGIDISNEAIMACKNKNLQAFQINDITDFAAIAEGGYDFAIMSHVLEHLEKPKVIPTLSYIRNELLSPSGKLMIMVPNAQSPSGTYWAYEDFTHDTLFTAGSLIYVLQSAGFNSIAFIDANGLAEFAGIKKVIKRILLNLFKLSQKVKFISSGATYHKPSPVIYTWEVKVLASSKI